MCNREKSCQTGKEQWCRDLIIYHKRHKMERREEKSLLLKLVSVSSPEAPVFEYAGGSPDGFLSNWESPALPPPFWNSNLNLLYLYRHENTSTVFPKWVARHLNQKYNYSCRQGTDVLRRKMTKTKKWRGGWQMIQTWGSIRRTARTIIIKNIFSLTFQCYRK